MSKWKWDGKYPVRCRIVDVDNPEYEQRLPGGFVGKTPEASKPHLGKEGNAVLNKGVVQITLDDGRIIYGHQCWWEPISSKEAA